MSKIYTLNLTREELWVLSESYSASFTDPDGRSEVEVRVSDKLKKLYARAHKASTHSPSDQNTPTVHRGT